MKKNIELLSLLAVVLFAPDLFARMKKRQEKIRALIANGKGIEEIKSEFEKSEARLIETICNEIKGR